MRRAPTRTHTIGSRRAGKEAAQWAAIVRSLRHGAYILATISKGGRLFYILEPANEWIPARWVDDAIKRGELTERDTGLIPGTGQTWVLTETLSGP